MKWISAKRDPWNRLSEPPVAPVLADFYSDAYITVGTIGTSYAEWTEMDVMFTSVFGTFFLADESTQDGLDAMKAFAQPDGLSWDELKQKHGL